MSETKKLLIGFGAVAVLCCCAAGLAAFAFREFGRRMEAMVDGDPAAIAEAYEDMAEFEVPPGYTPMALSIFGYQVVNLTPSATGVDMTIMLMQYSGLFTGSPEQMEQQLRQAAEQQSGQPGSSMHLVEVREVEIRGETVTATISEGGFEGFTLRQWTAVFSGNKGPVIMMVQGPAETWDEALLETFITSIR